ncbi:MAG: proline--tRNA ligase [Cyanobacteria bacterium HKST-UBA04]|nr:proline--tRNA ligase [Cyanobacteria bacterium HKST-UBA04]
MRMSQLFAPTLRENPHEAEVVSHQLLTRAGYIRQIARGIYNYLPLMQRVMKKVEAIVREEMDRAGAQELLMPIMQPADLWIESGRWAVYGKELIRFKDRHDRDCVLGPTHEEVITSTANNGIHSYKQLPVNLYQIQNKYRDEVRPRFGLLRGREFIMKDAYSFHTSQADLEREYDVMAEAYRRIFLRCGLDTRMVQSDSGAIGGAVSHEFMVLTQTHSGEDDVYYCDSCGYAANGERAESILPDATVDGQAIFGTTEQVVDTPDCDDIESLTKCLKMPASLICKALLYIKDETMPFLVFIRGDLEAEEIKVQNAVAANHIRLADADEVAEFAHSAKGYVGVAGWRMCNEELPGFEGRVSLVYRAEHLKEYHLQLPVLLDSSVLNLKNFAMANNEIGKHVVGYNWPHDRASQELLETNTFDLKRARAGDQCPTCLAELNMTRGIEVGNIFQLGTKYSEAMSATYTDEDGTEKHFVMGCYGIGISRTAAAAVERYHDQDGIAWPIPIAPYVVSVVPVNADDQTQWTLAKQLYDDLQAAGVEAVIDDRDERAGVKFKDSELMGFPIRVTVGKKAADGVLEVKLREGGDVKELPAAEVLPYIRSLVEEATDFAKLEARFKAGQPAAAGAAS